MHKISQVTAKYKLPKLPFIKNKLVLFYTTLGIFVSPFIVIRAKYLIMYNYHTYFNINYLTQRQLLTSLCAGLTGAESQVRMVSSRPSSNLICLHGSYKITEEFNIDFYVSAKIQFSINYLHHVVHTLLQLKM